MSESGIDPIQLQELLKKSLEADISQKEEFKSEREKFDRMRDFPKYHLELFITADEIIKVMNVLKEK